MKPGRNDPCSCGSGKKYKHCCLGKTDAPASSPALANKVPSSTSAPANAVTNQLIALFNAGHHAELESRARQIVEQHPGFATGWQLLGAALHMQGKDGLPTLIKTVELFPNDADAHNNLGNALMERELLEDAATSYRRAISLKPDFALAHYNLGAVLRELGEVNKAVECCRHALRLNPSHIESHINLGNFLKDLGQLEDSEVSYRKAMTLDPENTLARSNLLFILNYSSKHTPRECLDEAREYGRIVSRKATSPYSAWLSSPQPTRLRVGMISGDFQNHPVGYFLETLLKHIDRDRIELFAYPTSTRTDDLTSRIKPYFSQWRSLYNLDDAAAAKLIHDDGVHVLLDLSGHTAKTRLPIFAWKPAPVQTAWLGYYATTGVSEMDYLIADRTGVPEESWKHFSETIWYLPDTRLCFSPPDTVQTLSPLPALQNGFITFGSFQNMAKVGDEVLDLWSAVLNSLPDSRLRWQCAPFKDTVVVSQLLSRFKQHGIDPGRISLLGSVDREGYLAAHAEVDVLLDTFPFPGGTTTCEALWMGVPTITLAGDTLLSRQGASLLSAAGLEDWITSSKADYIARATALPDELPELSSLRASLRKQVSESPLFDAPRFARNLEDALWGMWQAHGGKTDQ